MKNTRGVLSLAPDKIEKGLANFPQLSISDVNLLEILGNDSDQTRLYNSSLENVCCFMTWK